MAREVYDLKDRRGELALVVLEGIKAAPQGDCFVADLILRRLVGRQTVTVRINAQDAQDLNEKLTAWMAGHLVEEVPF